MDLSDHYRDQLVALLPRGRVWPRHLGAVLPKLLHAWGDSLAVVQERALDLLTQRSPLLTYDLLDEWEADLGLPETCGGPAAVDANARRAAIMAKLLATAGMNKSYYEGILSAYGITATIDEFIPYSVDTDVDSPIHDAAFAFAWQINLPTLVMREFSVNDGVNDNLRDWTGMFIQCLLRRISPAHTILLFPVDNT